MDTAVWVDYSDINTKRHNTIQSSLYPSTHPPTICHWPSRQQCKDRHTSHNFAEKSLPCCFTEHLSGCHFYHPQVVTADTTSVVGFVAATHPGRLLPLVKMMIKHAVHLVLLLQTSRFCTGRRFFRNMNKANMPNNGMMATNPPTPLPSLPPTRLATLPPTPSPTLTPTPSPTLPPTASPTQPPTASPPSLCPDEKDFVLNTPCVQAGQQCPYGQNCYELIDVDTGTCIDSTCNCVVVRTCFCGLENTYQCLVTPIPDGAVECDSILCIET
jgi:hypothetical protein